MFRPSLAALTLTILAAASGQNAPRIVSTTEPLPRFRTSRRRFKGYQRNARNRGR